MKSIIKKLVVPSLAVMFTATSCNDFEDLNTDPYLASQSQVQVEYLINNSIVSAQQDPHIAERVFVLYWKTAGHQQAGGGISTGTHNNDWSTDYFGSGYMGKWLNTAYAAVDLAEKQIADGIAKPYTENLLQVARIWRVYLLSELADSFGPIPLDGFQGKNPTYSDVKTVYYYMLEELKDASAKIDVSRTAGDIGKFDKAYAFDFSKWQKYANSMRMRLAMRLSEVDPAKAQSEFEAAAALPYITNFDEGFKVQETGGWDALTGVMTREWNAFPISATQNNLYLGLGGVKTADQVGADKQASIKPKNYFGLKLDRHFTTMTNDPSAGFWLDGLPYSIDPRAFKTYAIPGDLTNSDFNKYPSWDNTASTTERTLVDASGAVVKTIDAKFSWNGFANGDWGAKGATNNVREFNGALPRHVNHFRNGTSQRVFFGPWESYFLMAEAAVRGWKTPVSGKVAYESGIDASFNYFGVTQFASAYKASTEYNRTGTSVSWDHEVEPPASYTITYIDGYNNAAGTTTKMYPKNDLYKNGTIKNDRLTKIITQKFIAQNPWLPLETWNDQRRLGLPFFENPAIENSLVNMQALTSANYMTSNVKFFPQRIKYPTSMQINNSAGYAQAVAALGGADEVLTPLWWAKK
jgi:hypothetical protein